VKILFTGHCNFDIISNLTDYLKKNMSDVEISVTDIFNPGKEITETDLKRFESVLNFPTKKSIAGYDNKETLKTFSEIMSSNDKRRYLIMNLLLFRYDLIKKYFHSETLERIYSRKMNDFFSKFDIIHMHYLAPGFLSSLKYVDKKKKIILSVWGSDLFQMSGVKDYSSQLEAIDRADIITMYTIEVREVFLSKFGRQYSEKIRLAPFGQPEKIFDSIDSKLNPETKKEFRNKYNIGVDKIIITIGYNASSKQNHIDILKNLNLTDTEIKKKIHAVIPMTYGLQYEKDDYLQKVKNACSACDFGTTMLTDYMSDEDWIKAAAASDIKLNLRETDCMNGAMIESLYAGNIVVNGAWLPYGTLRRRGVHFTELEKVDDIKETIPRLINNFEKEKQKSADNALAIKNFISYENAIKNWVKIYDELRN